MGQTHRMRPGALIFDMDGTVVDNMAFHNQTWIELLAGHGVHTEVGAFFRATAGMTNPTIFRHYFGDQLSEIEISELSAEKESIYRDRYRLHVQPMPGLIELLTTAKAHGVPTGLATSAPQDNIDFILDGAGLGLLFDCVVGAHDVTRSKPDPEIYLVAAKKLGVSPEACIAFEDAPMGIESAVRAGMHVVVITTVLSAEEARELNGVKETAPDFRGLAERWFE